MIDEKNIDVDWQETRRFLEEKYFSKIRELSKKYDYPCENIAIDFNWVFGLIEKIEQQPKTDWIPCEERLPKTLGVYQTVRKVIEGDRIYYLEGASYFDGQNTWHNDIGVNHGRECPNVVAWQQIQPYKKEGAE